MTTTAPATSVKQSTVTIIREKKEHYKPELQTQWKWAAVYEYNVKRNTKMLYAFIFPEESNFSFRVGYINDKNQLVVPIDNKREQVIGTLDELYPVFAMELPTKDLFNFENPDWDFGLSTSFIIKNVLN